MASAFLRELHRTTVIPVLNEQHNASSFHLPSTPSTPSTGFLCALQMPGVLGMRTAGLTPASETLSDSKILLF